VSKRRKIDGVLLLNKPVGITSNTALQRVKRLFQAAKAGHTGSLDKLASGLLPICLGEATKLSSFLLEADKHYQAICTLGITTSTGDAEGDIIATAPVPPLDLHTVEPILESFRGTIQQIPPMYSALKHQGQALYKLARQGQIIDRQPRSVVIYSITVQSLLTNQLALAIHCSKGTYIRTLAEDLGKAFGCGAYLSSLHRTQIGPYREMIDFSDLEQADLETLDKLLLPMHTALSNWPEITLSSQATHYVLQGQAVQIAHAPTSGWVKLFSEQGHFLGVGKILEDGRVAPKRLINL